MVSPFSTSPEDHARIWCGEAMPMRTALKSASPTVSARGFVVMTIEPGLPRFIPLSKSGALYQKRPLPPAGGEATHVAAGGSGSGSSP